MSMYRREWDCCGSVTETDAWAPESCPFCETQEDVMPPFAAPASQHSAWLPIESAPKNGRTLILLLTPSRFPQVAYSNTWWTSGFSVENKPTHWMPLPQPPQEVLEQPQV